MPTKRRRHAITETPRVQAALDELRQELGAQGVELGELVVLGAGVKLEAIRSERTGEAAARRRLADRVRSRGDGSRRHRGRRGPHQWLGSSLTAELLIDNSAWARLDQAALAQNRAEEIAGWLEGGRIATCLPFLLEAGYSARNARDFDALLEELMSLPEVAINEQVEARAINAQRQLARAGHHRLPPVDLIVAALADHARARHPALRQRLRDLG